MTLPLPRPVPLPDPPGTPGALAAATGDLQAAGRAAGVAVQLLAPATVLSGWQGADADVAAGEVAATLGVAGDLHAALVTAADRVAAHLELLRTVRSGVARLQEEQRADFAAAGSRLAVLTGTAAESGLPVRPPAEAVQLVTAVASRDEERAVEHGALLAALADDAGATTVALAAAAGSLGGTGSTGADVAVTTRLAAQLPGWGAGALSALGGRAADEMAGSRTPAELDAAVAHWRPAAALPGFAEGLVGGLGVDGTRWLLALLGQRAGTPAGEPLAALLATVLGSGDGRGAGRVAAVLDGLAPADDDPDGISHGMAAVLAVPGAGVALAARWGRDALAREAARGVRASGGAPGGARQTDPLDAALAVLARAGDPVSAARLLADPAAWTTVLSRPWPQGTGDLAAVVRLAAAAPDAGRTARAALLALGAGLGPEGRGQALDDAGALRQVRSAVADLVAGQPGVLLPVLDAAATGAVLDSDSDTTLRGLAHLETEAAAAAAVSTAVRAALRAGDAGASAGEVAGVHVAVLEHAQRLRYALDWSRAHGDAVDRQVLWTLAVTLPVALIPGPAGELAGAVADVLAGVLDCDGDVEIGPDRGRVHTADDAARFAEEILGPAPVPGARIGAGAAARVGFDRASAALGRLAPEESLLDRIGELPLPDVGRRPRGGG